MITLVSGSAANVGITLPRIVLGPGTKPTSVSAFVEGLETLYWHSDPADPIASVTQFMDYAAKGWDVRVDFGSARGAASAVWNKDAAGNVITSSEPEVVIRIDNGNLSNVGRSDLEDYLTGRLIHEMGDPVGHTPTIDPSTGKTLVKSAAYPLGSTGHSGIDLTPTNQLTVAVIMADPTYGREITDAWKAGFDFPDGNGGFVAASLNFTEYSKRSAEAVIEAYKDRRESEARRIRSSVHARDPVNEIITTGTKIYFEEVTGVPQIGSLIGSTLGQFLSNGNAVKGVIYSSFLGELGERLGAMLVGGAKAENVVPSATDSAAASFGTDVLQRMKQAAIGSASSLLSMELGEALGLHGFGAELFNTVGSTVLNKTISNLLNPNLGPSKMFDGFNTDKILKPGGVGTLAASAVASFIGSKLGAMVVQPHTQAAVALSSIGSALGVWALTTSTITIGTGATASALGAALFGNSWMALNVIAPGVGAFVGFVLGALIGNLFGKKKPKIPSASAETVLQIPYARYELGAVTVTNNGNRDLVTSMATTARDTLNGLIAMVAYTDTTAYVSNLNGYGTTQAYGHTANQIYVKVNGVQTNFSSADQAVEFGTLAAIRNTKIVGGDIFAKRAIARSPAADLTSLTGDLQIASDYRFYASNRALVNGFITGAYATLTQGEQDFYGHPPHKALIDKLQTQGAAALTADETNFYNAYKPTIDKIIGALENQALANPWIITLQRVSELGLDKWTPSDFYGGLQGFLGSFDLAGHGTALENANFVWNGTDFTVSVAGGTEGVLSLLASASADGRSATINGLDKIAYTWVNAGGATAGNDYMEYRWNGGGVTLDDQHDEQQTTYDYYWNGYEYEQYETTITVSVSGGDDIFVGSQYNDALYGRTGWDWLDGQGGDDYVDGGDQNDTLLGGAGRDRLYGGAGDDYLAGGDGDDAQATWGDGSGGLFGGAGDDILVGNAGADEIWGEDGDDVMIVDYDGGGVYDRYEGGAGSDTISYERFGQAAGVDFRNTSPWGDPWEYIYGDAVSAENITGSAFNDWFCCDDNANVLKGMAGNDELHGWGGDDTIEGGTGADILNGWGGTDTLSYAGSMAGVFIDLSTGEAFGGDAAGDTFTAFENVTGSRLADQLKGDAGANRLAAGAGDDWLVATAGGDRYEGGEGKDFVDYSASTEGVYLILSSYTPTFQYDGTGYTGLANGHTYNNVEGVVGSAYTDYLYGGEGDQTFVGGAGTDYLAGAAGADTYVINRGDGYDTVTEDNTGWNVLSFGETVKFSDLWFGTAGGANGWLDVGVRGDNAQFRVSANFANLNSSKIKTLDLNGAGQLDVDGIEYAPAASDNSEAVNGWSGRRDLIVAYNGDDSITGSGGAWEDKGNVVIGGLGNDVITTSGGDDQFAYDRGDGLDSINDAGGEDTIVFGATVTAEDVIYQVVGDHLYIGAKNPLDPNQTAYYTPDHIQIWNGGVKYVVKDAYTDQVLYETLNTVEYVIAGGTSIDLRKLNINWTEQVSYNYDNYYPIALDLDGDGLNLSAVDSSQVVVKTAGGGVSRIGWVGPTDGFLAVDRDGDGAINKLSEISFVQDKPGATSDLEGLRTWDTNGDGVLDKADKDFGKILLFVDANQNGRSTAKELRTLEQAGIKAINLGGTATGYTRDMTIDSFVQNTISFVWADGRAGEGYDVALARRVLGSEGLYAGAYQAEWGARDEDGTLGRLVNDPKTAAKAARIQAKRGLLDKLGASYAEVKAAAQIDFSDTDKVDAQVAKRWAKMDASQKAAWLSGQATGMDGQQNLARLKAVSSGQALSNALNDSVQAGQDLASQGLVQARAQVSESASRGSGTSGRASPDGLGVAFGAASGLSSGLGGGLAASQPLDAASLAGARIGQDQAWWRGEAGAELSGAGSLAALLATMDQGVGASAPGALSATDDPALLQQQMLLRQAMAGFGGQPGGSAAVWNRDAVQASATLAAADQAKTPSAFNLALAS